MQIDLRAGRLRTGFCAAYVAFLAIGFAYSAGLLATCMVFCFSTCWLRPMLKVSASAASHNLHGQQAEGQSVDKVDNKDAPQQSGEQELALSTRIRLAPGFIVDWSWSLGPVLLFGSAGGRYTVLRDEVTAREWAALHRHIHIGGSGSGRV